MLGSARFRAAMGQSRRFPTVTGTSAMPPIADMTADILDGSEWGQ
jgi:hypothetical protein